MIKDAAWIMADADLGDVCPRFCRTVTPRKKVLHAEADVTALGIFRFAVDGREQGDALLTPGLTSYTHRIQYFTYDITSYMTQPRTLSVTVGRGWALSDWYWHYTVPAELPRVPRAIAEVRITYEDGTQDVVHTDASWEVYRSESTYAELYFGETYDATADTGFVGHAKVARDFSTELVAQQGECVREMKRLPPVRLIVTPKGERVLDFGQNMAGYVELRRRGQVGDRVVLSHAEVLDKNGNFYNENYRQAKSLITYISGGGDEIFKPKFTFQGFRYVRLDEYPCEEIDLSEFCAVAIYSDMERTGHFLSGNEKINRLYRNVLWGQRSNFVDIPTDCPQRDERMGWTGDAQVFCRTAAINYNVKRFFFKWLEDMRLEQDIDGGVFGFVPSVKPYGQYKGAGWGDAAVICPYELYLAYGDRDMLAHFYPMMKRWVAYEHGAGDPADEYLWIGDDQWGDWLAMDAGDGFYNGATQNDLVASAYFARSAYLCALCAEALGEQEDARYFTELFSKVRTAFRAAFMKDGMPVMYPKGDAFSTNRPVKARTQTSLSLILRFGLCEEAERQPLCDELVRLIEENGGRMSTGFLGTANLLHALSENGRTDVAYELLLSEKNPSWLFSVNRGATTMWEHWDSMNEQGDFWSADMNSFNHYAYGAVYDWIYGYIGGIRVLPDGAGYTHVVLEPHTDRRLGFVRISYQTARGELSSAWEYTEDGRRFDVTVPLGTVAELTLPNGEAHRLTEGTYSFLVRD